MLELGARAYTCYRRVLGRVVHTVVREKEGGVLLLEAYGMDLLDRIESRFRVEKAVAFALRYWHWSIYISIIYAASVFGLKRWMRDREKYDLGRPLFMWSLALSLFSTLGFYNAGLTHLRVAWEEGWETSICAPIVIKGRVGLWLFVFCFSKLPELCDTYFIVLRKQKLIFLHWYHHITVFIYGWHSYAWMVYPAQWFMTMNNFVHSIMYFYYAVRASGRYRPPVWVNIIITTLQLLQMMVGVMVNVYVYWKMVTDESWYCDGRVETTVFYVYWAFAMYLTYFVLFAHFFYTTYFRRKQDRSKRPVNESVSTVQPIETTVNTQNSETGLPNGTASGVHQRYRLNFLTA